jgi:hypothetical protein
MIYFMYPYTYSFKLFQAMKITMKRDGILPGQNVFIWPSDLGYFLHSLLALPLQYVYGYNSKKSGLLIRSGSTS